VDKVKELYKSFSAWFGIVDEADMPKFLYSPEDLNQALSDDELADEVTLHTEIIAGECTCGLALEYTGIPVQTQRGHAFHGQPTSVLLFESVDGFKLQCQDCLYDWPVYEMHCEHGNRNESAHCRYCVHDIVRQASRRGCAGHSQLRKTPGPFKKIFELANPGFMVYMGVCLAYVLAIFLASVNLLNFDLASLPKHWQVMAFLGAALWALGYYLAESNPEVTAKLKSRAVGTWLWGIFSIFSTAAMKEIDQVIAQVSEVLGLG
jgi:hypothetical protein